MPEYCLAGTYTSTVTPPLFQTFQHHLVSRRFLRRPFSHSSIKKGLKRVTGRGGPEIQKRFSETLTQMSEDPNFQQKAAELKTSMPTAEQSRKHQWRLLYKW